LSIVFLRVFVNCGTVFDSTKFRGASIGQLKSFFAVLVASAFYQHGFRFDMLYRNK